MRSCTLQDLLNSESLKRIVSRVQSIPTLPGSYLEVMKRLRSSETAIEEISDVISKDIGMTAKIMQLVNSAFFGLPRHVDSPAQAISLLGISTVRILVTSLHIFAQFDVTKLKRFSLDQLWSHSMACGGFARRIAKDIGLDHKKVELAFMAGVLHDLGKLLVATNLEDEFARALSLAQKERITEWQAEAKVWGTTHAEVGAYLLGLWGFADPLVDAIAHHHIPSRDQSEAYELRLAVHVADVFEYELRKTAPEIILPAVDSDFLTAHGLKNELPRWRTICEEIVSEEESDEG